MSTHDSTVPFDTLKFVKRLVAAGVPRDQADAEAEALAEALNQLATKKDLKAEIQLLGTEMRAGFVDLEHRLTLKLGGTIVVTAALIVSLLKLIP